MSANPNDEKVHDLHRLRPLAVEELFQRPEPKWIIRHVLRERSLGVLFGPTGSGKTFLALDLALAAVHRKHWFGLRVRQGNVIYVAGEGHLILRIKAYMARHSVDAADLEPFRVVASNVNLLERQSDDLVFLLRELQLCAGGMGNIALVVIDTLNAVMCGGDENSSQDMGLIIDAAKQIMAVLGCAVLFVHHSGKDESKGSRGHSSLKAALDTEIQISSNGAGRTAELTKARDGESGQQFPFTLEAVDLGPDPDPDADDGDRITSCVVVALDRLPANRKSKPAAIPKSAALALRALREAIGEHGETLAATSAIPPGARGVTVDQWRERYYVTDPLEGVKDKATESDTRLTRFRRAKTALLNAGAVMACSQWVWIA